VCVSVCAYVGVIIFILLLNVRCIVHIYMCIHTCISVYVGVSVCINIYMCECVCVMQCTDQTSPYVLA
jgi:hypothetical protein